MSFWFLLLSIFNISFHASLSSISLNGGNYGLSYQFIISGTTEESITGSINIPIKILIEEEEKEAKCSVENTENGAIAIYTCIYEGNINGAVFLKKEQDNFIFTGLESNIEINPININIEFLDSTDLDFIDNIWQYNLKGKTSTTSETINLGSIFYMDIKVNDSNAIAGCAFNSKEELEILLFNCKINSISQELSNKIIIPSVKSERSTITFSGLNEEKKFIIHKTIPFIEAKNLVFTESKWQFSIIVPFQVVPVGTKSIVDILYNGYLSFANCITNDNSMLDCVVEYSEEQTEEDLIKIHFIKSSTSTIGWKNLTRIYEIPIEKRLVFIKNQDLTYTSTKIWQFKIYYSSEAILPENGLVTIDFKINDISTIVKCYHLNSEQAVLNCKTEVTEKENTLSLKISYEKKYGSISFDNIISKDVPITTSYAITYENAYDLKYSDNCWNFLLKASINEGINEEFSNIFPISVKIKYGEGEEKTNAVAYCYPMEDSLYKCEAYYENQRVSHLILLNGEETQDVSVTWNNNFDEKYIILSASLHFTDIYDLMYLNEKWNFKIKVEETLPNNAKLIVDIYFNATNSDTATCTYNDNILSCTRDSLVQSPSESLSLKRDKEFGSTIWQNSDISESVEIPLSITTNIIKAYGLNFNQKWNFFIDIDNIGIIPDNSFFKLDIFLNNQDSIAICELSERIQSTKATLSCHLDDESQSITDEIKLNTEKNSGSITWSNTITILNNTISETSSEPASLYLLDAYNLKFENNVWSFTIIGKVGRDLLRGEIFIIEIVYISSLGEFYKNAKCWANGGKANEDNYFSCTVQGDDQNEESSILLKYYQSEASTLTWSGGIDDNYQITLTTSLDLIKAYDMTFDGTYKFSIIVGNGILPPGSKIFIDIIIGSNTKSISCNSLNKTLIICDTGSSSKMELVKLSEINLSDRSVIWKANIQNDYLIYLNIEFEFKNAFNLFFNEEKNKWIFILEKNADIPLGSKLSIDITYNRLPAVATCFYNNNNNNEIECSVDKEEQNKMDLVKINHIKTTKSSITLINLLNDEGISLIANLNFDRTDNLRKDSNGYWVFDIYITDQTIPNYSKFIIDIYYKINSIQYNSEAVCYLDNKLLSCTTQLNTYELVSIKLTKTTTSKSTVTWINKNNFSNDNVPIIITTSLEYINTTTILSIENNYYFYITINNYVPQEGKVLIDIKADNQAITSECIAETITKLKCQINNGGFNNNTLIYVTPTKSIYSTTTWVNLEENVRISNIYLGFIGAYDKKNIDERNFEFKILTSGNNLPSNTQVYIRINYVDEYGNVIDTSIVSCISENEFLKCTAEIKSDAKDFNVYLTSSPSSSSYGVIWSNGNNNYTPISTKTLSLNSEIDSYNYNTNTNRYEFNIKDNEYSPSSSSNFFVTDVKIGEVSTYAYCNYNNGYFNCKTNTVNNYNPNDEIYISNTKTYGNVEWKDLSEDENKIIKNLYKIEYSHLYGLTFDTTSSKWKFKIESESSLIAGKTYIIDILISNQNGKANCVVNENILECTVDADEQSADQSIKINTNNINGDIKLVNLENQKIPLDIVLKFNKFYQLSYDSYNLVWVFEIQAELDEGTVIPNYSTFTLDIKNDNNNDIAICSKKNINGNIIILSCETKNIASENSLISLNNVKSNYSSITWKERIPDNNIEAFISGYLYVDTINNLIYDSNTEKWSFTINPTSSYDFPLNSKIKIDLKYNNEETSSTATCTYISYKFYCIPDIENQSENDFFEIKKDKLEGTVSILNDNEKDLIILSSVKLTFVMAYDLQLINNYWHFKIKVSENNLYNKRTTIVDYKEYNYKTAICSIDNNILSCTSLEYSYYYDYPVYLVNKQSSYVDWNNVYNDKYIYVNYFIQLINIFGTFMENTWKFNIEYEIEENYNIYYNNYALVDILVNDQESTALCKITYQILECESNHVNQKVNDRIEIVGNSEPNLGTVYFTSISEENQKQIKPASIIINLLKIDSKLYSNDKLFFSINGYLANSLYNKAAIYTEIEIKINKTNNELFTSRASCEIIYNHYDSEYRDYYSEENGVLLNCYSDNKVSKSENTEINIDSNGYSRYVKFVSANKQDLKINTDSYYDKWDYENDEKSDENINDTTIEEATEDNKTKKIILGVTAGFSLIALVTGGVFIGRKICSASALSNGTNALPNNNQLKNQSQQKSELKPEDKIEKEDNNNTKEKGNIRKKKKKSNTNINNPKKGKIKIFNEHNIRSQDGLKLNFSKNEAINPIKISVK